MSTYSSIACSEEYVTVQETSDVFAGFSARVTLRCAISNLQALITDILGTPRIYPNTSAFNAYAVRAVARPDAQQYTASGQACAYTGDALVDIDYSTQVFDVAAESLEPTMEAIPLDYSRFNWGGAGGPLLVEGEAPPLILRSCNLTRTRFRLAAIPTDVLGAVGFCNQFSYTSAFLGLTFPAQTLLFLPAPVQRSFTNYTSLGFTLTLKFSFKPQGWNFYWRAETQAWEQIYLNGSSSPYLSYPTYDFSALFS